MGIIGTSALGEVLLKAKLISEEQLLHALRLQKKDGKRLGSVLLSLGYISESDLVSFLSRQYSLPAIKSGELRIDPSLLKILPHEIARKNQVVPLSWDGDSLRIATADPSNSAALDDIKFFTGKKVSLTVAAESVIADAIERYYSRKEPMAQPLRLRGESPREKKPEEEILEVDDLNRVIDSAVEDLTSVEDIEEDAIKEIDAPLIKLVNNILLRAIQSGASDIHIEPSEKVVSVRYRIDGVLQSVLKLPVKIRAAITSRIKIMSHLDISERRLPQDGRIKIKLSGDREIDLRVSTLPTQYGEKVVLRLLDKSSLQLDLTRLGFEEGPIQDFHDAIEKPYGMILVTGPTGSGKTTTLYSALSLLNKPEVNIMTAEDPIEYSFFGINQVQIREEIGLTFASALRSFLRQDPDIIMVGEVRDFETAEIAIKAALTGHLVLSTLHTNDAPSTLTRLVNMGIEPFLVTASVILIVAQRLVRKVCPHCKEEQKFPEAALIKMGFDPESIGSMKCYHGKGCPACNNIGYKGRQAIYEVMPIKEELKELILQGASAFEIKKEAMRLGMLTLRQSAVSKVMAGVTSIDELLRVTFED
ncbi:MAG TPA: type IV-A pilus assembly ATPase PilB [Dissulfurispiraceae bacterium]|nr:type IV-A pilus assembly ATPase PilB [Dissulfurispiraceae bacterium]